MVVLAGLVPSTCGYKANTLTELALRFSVTQLISSYNYRNKLLSLYQFMLNIRKR